MRFSKTLVCLALSINISNSSASTPEKIELETYHAPTQIPDSCKDIAEQAKKNYGKVWAGSLIKPAETIHRSAEKTQKLVDDNAEKGRYIVSLYLAPIGTVAVFQDRVDLFGGHSSLFLDCDKRRAYISQRRGFQGTERWYGPFDF